MTVSLPQLIETVQTNCYINDARHAQDMTMCTYLLEMRQYYRWEHSVPFSRRLPKEDLGDWLTEREALWITLEESDYQPIVTSSGTHDPFAAERINRDLLPEGLVYSAGIGRFGRPHFFLGRLHKREQRDGFNIYSADCEYARDLVAPPTALLQRDIFIRREIVQDFLWGKLEEWNWKRQDNALGRALQCYDFDQHPDTALEKMTDAETEAMILHELGEGHAGELLGESRWQEMLAGCTKHKPEIIARAVRDNLADCVMTLPNLIARGEASSIHFYFGNFSGMRAKLFPAAYNAYHASVEHGHWVELKNIAERGRDHWLMVAEKLLAVDRANPDADALLAAMGEDAVL
ncbi:MAG: Sfum_1244 family protein [Pseudomonadota bacterium]